MEENEFLRLYWKLYPSATIYTLFHERGKLSSAFIESHPIVTSWLNRIPGIYRYYRNLLPLFPSAVESFHLEKFDLVISSSHAVAKGVRCGNSRHICYLPYADALCMGRRKRLCLQPCQAVGHGVGPKVSSAMGPRNGRSSRSLHCEFGIRVRPHPQILWSRCRRRLSSYRYHLLQAFGQSTRQLLPCGGRHCPGYKRLDVAIEAFNSLGYPLVIAGIGPELKRLRKLAGSNIKILGWVTDEELRRLYQSARALVFPAREDFGMIPVEAQACGCPVIAYAGGGCLETVKMD